jgi:hypothetical protein
VAERQFSHDRNHAAGAVDVVATVEKVGRPTSEADRFTYL